MHGRMTIVVMLPMERLRSHTRNQSIAKGIHNMKALAIMLNSRLSGFDCQVKAWMIETLANTIDNHGTEIFGAKQPNIVTFRDTIEPMVVGMLIGASDEYKLKTIKRVWNKLESNDFLCSLYDATYYDF